MSNLIISYSSSVVLIFAQKYVNGGRTIVKKMMYVCVWYQIPVLMMRE